MVTEGFIAVLVFTLGLAFGSFANVVIWRFPRGESMSFPPSHCPACGTPVLARDNVPVISWLLLRARCRSCAAPISTRYPLVELLSGILWLLAYVLFGATLTALFAAAMFYLLLILAFIDADTMRLPNPLVALLAAVGVGGVITAHIFQTPAVPIALPNTLVSPVVWAMLGLVAGGGLALAMSLLYAVVRKSAGLGMGDVKLLGAMGLFLGPYVLLSLFFGSLFGAVFALTTKAGKVAGRKIPFGPFLALGGVVCAAIGPQLVDWYLGIL